MNAIPQPLDGEVHLYRLSLSHEAFGLTRCERILSATEMKRADLLKSDLARKRFITGRGLLRDVLGGYLDSDPADVKIATGEHGKPFLTDGAADLRFNLSHVDDILVIAVAAGVEVGVDIEKIDANKPVHDMARLAFSLREQKELSSTTPSQQIKAFHRCWARKEACLKACGIGFSLPGSSFDVPVCLEEPPASTLINCNHSLWHVHDVDVPENYCAAVAVEAGGESTSPPDILRLVTIT